MSKLVVFRPQHIDARLNFRDYIAAAKTVPMFKPYGIKWDDDTWILTGLAKPTRSSSEPMVRFGVYKGCKVPLAGNLAQFARAYVALGIGKSFGNPYQEMKYTKPVLRMRDLQEAMVELGVPCPTELTPEVIEITCEKLAKRSTTKNGLMQSQANLKWVFDAMREAKLLCKPFEWTPPISGRGSFLRRSRIMPEKSRTRGLTTDEVTAIATAFHRAETPKEQITTGILALLCCVPARIEELLELPADTKVTKIPGQGYRAGIRWWPKKGGAPQIKWVPDAMLPVARLALERLRRHTSSARKLAKEVMAGRASIDEPRHWPYIAESSPITYDRALMVTPHRLLSKHSPDFRRIERIYYQQVVRLISRSYKDTENIFDEMRITLPDGSPVDITTHMMRHYLNTIANRASVPQADIALWSGRKSLGQNAAYDHESPQELINRVRATFPKSESLVKIPIDQQADFDVAQIKETAHTTPFGWCLQSLRQSPCEMYGKCLNCQNLVCIKGADGKLENIRRELDREKQLRQKALEKQAEGLKVNPRWFEQFDSRIQRLTELVDVLSNPKVTDGSPVMLKESKRLPQFRTTGPRVKPPKTLIEQHPSQKLKG